MKNFKPNVNTLTAEDFRNVNPENIFAYPVPFVSTLSLILFSLLACNIVKSSPSRPTLAVDRVLPM